MVIYQMKCTGEYSLFKGQAKLFSENVYKNKEDITDEVIENFKKACIDGKGFYDLKPETVKVTIHELNLKEDTENQVKKTSEVKKRKFKLKEKK